MSDDEFPWVDGTEQPFRIGIEGSLNADIGRPRGRDLRIYAYGYRRSAEMLFDAICEGRYADSQYFALAFLWRQALELTLKAMHEDFGQFKIAEHLLRPTKERGQSEPVHYRLKGHDLKKLWGAIEPQLHEMFPEAPEIGWIANAIDQFHDVDPGAEGFRYPTRLKDGKPTLESLPRLVNFEDLDRNMRALLNALESAATEITTRLDGVFGALADMGER